MDKVRIGVVGCGMISEIYLANLTGMFAGGLEVCALADLDAGRAAKRAAQFGVPRVMATEEMLASPDIELVALLTLPATHYLLAKQALLAGKHVYTEKPLALDYGQGLELHTLAKEKGLLLGGAPDTFLGAGIATSAALVREGAIGQPVAATAFMISHGWEDQHENPDFYYTAGGGPMFDMGPYYITALVSMLGRMSAVCAMASQIYPTRTVGCGPRKGQAIPVEVPTHIAGQVDFANGCIASVITSFDMWETGMPNIQVFGTEATLIAPDPNTFAGPVVLCAADGTRREMPLQNRYTQNSRGLGIWDMAEALRTGKEPRAGSHLTLHVLEAMEAFHKSSREGRFMKLASGQGL